MKAAECSVVGGQRAYMRKLSAEGKGGRTLPFGSEVRGEKWKTRGERAESCLRQHTERRIRGGRRRTAALSSVSKAAVPEERNRRPLAA
ncbi:hypothetical protein ACFX1R_045884 [Malus domestica]